MWRARAVSWEIFRCNVDCEKEPDNCISERLYHQQADALATSSNSGLTRSQAEARCGSLGARLMSIHVL